MAVRGWIAKRAAGPLTETRAVAATLLSPVRSAPARRFGPKCRGDRVKVAGGCSLWQAPVVARTGDKSVAATGAQFGGRSGNKNVRLAACPHRRKAMLQRAARAKAKHSERSVGEEDVADAVGGLGGGGFGCVEGGEAAVGAERDGGVFVGGDAGGVRHVRRAG